MFTFLHMRLNSNVREWKYVFFLPSYSCCSCVFNVGGSCFSVKCHWRQIKHETCSHVGLNMKGCNVNTEPRRGQRSTERNANTQIMRSSRVEALPVCRHPSSLWASCRARSLKPPSPWACLQWPGGKRSTALLAEEPAGRRRDHSCWIINY